MKHFDTHVRLAIGWKIFGINALKYFSCLPDKSVCWADNNKSASFSSLPPNPCPPGPGRCSHTPSRIPPRQILMKMFYIVRSKQIYLSLSLPIARGLELPEEASDYTQCGARDILNSISIPTRAVKWPGPGRLSSLPPPPPPPQIWHFSIILSHSGSTFSNNPGQNCQVQWTVTNSMIEFHPNIV